MSPFIWIFSERMMLPFAQRVAENATQWEDINFAIVSKIGVEQFWCYPTLGTSWIRPILGAQIDLVPSQHFRQTEICYFHLGLD